MLCPLGLLELAGVVSGNAGHYLLELPLATMPLLRGHVLLHEAELLGGWGWCSDNS